MRPIHNYCSFFEFIRRTFGFHAFKLLKSWIFFRKAFIKSRLRSYFLRKCISLQLTPAHVKSISRFNVYLFSYKCRRTLLSYTRNFSSRLIKLELKDSYCYTRFVISKIYKLSRSIYKCIPEYICNGFFSRQDRSLHWFGLRERERLDNKLDWLVKKHLENTRVRPIRYSYSFPQSSSSPKFSLEQGNHTNQANQTIVTIVPPKCVIADPFSVKNKWFKNLSSCQIPEDIQGLLQLGDNFSLPFNNKEKTTMEFIKNIEFNIQKLPIPIQMSVRNRSSSIINGKFLRPSQNSYNRTLVDLTRKTKRFLQSNPSLILTRADKGNVTVALDRDVYIEKMEALLGDKDTYNVLKKDPTKKITMNLREMLTRWKHREYISPALYRSLYCSDGVMPRAYGLPKIHKENCPLRVIVSSIDSPLYSLATFLHKFMYKYFPKTDSHIANSFDLVKKLTDVFVDDEYCLISLDVISLFTNIPLDLAYNSIAERWTFLSDHCPVPKDEFLIAVNLVLRSTFFMFNGIIYQQTFGTPMGSPLSPIIADIVLQDLERRALDSLNLSLPFYYRYVDDIACAIPLNKVALTLTAFNSFHPRLQFTAEISENNKLNFLDITIILENNHLIFDWFHKPTFSGRYLNFLSQHPSCQKRGTVISLTDRAFLLSHPRFHAKNFKLIIDHCFGHYTLRHCLRNISKERLSN